MVLRACFEQRLFTELPPGPVPFVNVEMDGNWHPHGSDDLRRLSDTLTAHADRLRELADRLDGLTNALRDHETRTRVLEKARWPLPSIVTVTAVRSLALRLYEVTGH
ncbi:DUF6907 domain-containing protein [Streptomyces nodosus]